MSEPTRDDLEQAVRAVVSDCLGVAAGEDVLVVCNPATEELGALMRTRPRAPAPTRPWR